MCQLSEPEWNHSYQTPTNKQTTATRKTTPVNEAERFVKAGPYLIQTLPKTLLEPQPCSKGTVSVSESMLTRISTHICLTSDWHSSWLQDSWCHPSQLYLSILLLLHPLRVHSQISWMCIPAATLRYFQISTVIGWGEISQLAFKWEGGKVAMLFDLF